jgi:hypothetical protein
MRNPPSLRTVTRRVPACSALLALALLVAAVPASAQTIRGQVLDGMSKQALTDVTVSLMDPDAVVLDSVAAGPDGSFELPVPGPGDYYLRADRDRYTTVVDGIFEFFAEEGEMSVVMFMNPRPFEIEGIDVQVEREQVRRKLRSVGFYERAATGLGRFIGPAQLRERIMVNIGDILRGIPGIVYDGDTVLFRSFGLDASGTCAPNVFIDGTRLFGQVQLDAVLDPNDVEAVEVFRGVAQIPLEYSGFNGSCGTMLIWTKAGGGGTR